MSIARTHHRFSLADYEQMIDLGILTENDRVELIRGEIIEKMSIGELHAACVKRLNRIFNVRLANKACVGVQDPIRLEDSEPEPDVTLLVPRADDYADGHPESEDVILVVEVADSSIDFDRVVKREIYAENGIVEFWILNLADRTLEVYRQPQADGQYADIRVMSSAEKADMFDCRVKSSPSEISSHQQISPPSATGGGMTHYFAALCAMRVGSGSR